MTDITQELINELPKAILNWYPFINDAKALLITHDDEGRERYKSMLETAGVCTDALLVKEYDNVVPREVFKYTDVSDDDNQGGSDNDEEEVDSYVEQDSSDDKDYVLPVDLSGDYDYVILIDAFEYIRSPKLWLKDLNRRLKNSGKLLIAMDNRLGLRYFCGDKDPFTKRNFDGIEEYIRINEEDRAKLEGRGYSRGEAVELLAAAGLTDVHSFSVLPCIEEPQLFYAEDYLPEENLDIRFNFHYRHPETVFLEEENMYSTLIREGMFHQMAGGYLLEVCKSEDKNSAFNSIRHITISMERGREQALATIIKKNDTVVKKAVYPEGIAKLNTLYENNEYLKAHGVRVVDAHIEGNEYVMPYVKGEPATSYFRRLLKEDVMLLYRELKRYYDIVEASSEAVSYDDIDWYHYKPGNEKQKDDDPNYDKWKKIAYSKPNAVGKILQKGFLDLVSINCFVVDGEFVFFDQEFTIDNLPAYTILWRTIDFIYWGDPHLEKIYEHKKLYDNLGLYYPELFASFSHDYIGKLRHWKELRFYHEDHVRNANIVNSNRQRMNYSQEEYQRLFVDIFKGIDGRKLYLFGSGNYAKKFISQFGNEVTIEGLLDNSQNKWGEDLLGYEILDPSVLEGQDPAKYKVIICIKNYIPVLKQLKEMGAINISFYDWNLEYEHARSVTASTGNGATDKPYHIGYIAGVFDLFHVGHLNLLRRAKEMCDYLIVGVVSDSGVIDNKKTSPYIPFAERLDIVQSCQYVDEAVEIPREGSDTDEAYRRYQFDVQFSGSDYADDPDWLAKQAYLRKRGSDLVFFPYTQSTSSTKLKAVISKEKEEQIKKNKEKMNIKDTPVEEEVKNAGNNELKITCMTNAAIEPHRPNQGIDLFKKTGYDGMVMNLGDYCTGSEIKRLGKKVVSVDVQRYEKVTDNPKLLWQYGFEEVKIATDKKLPIPMMIAPRKDRDTKREDLDDFLAILATQTMQLCKDANCNKVLVYPNSYQQTDNEKVTEWYDSLVSEAKACGVQILVANQCKDIYGHLVRGIFSDMPAFAQWIDGQNNKHGKDTFGICLDVGTTNICGQDLQEIIPVLGDRIKAVMVRENDGYADSSMLPYMSATKGSSTMDYMGLIRGLRTIDYTGLLVLDMRDTCASVPTKLRDGLVKLGKEFMDFLAWQIGMEKGLKKYSQRVLFGAGNMCRAYMKCYGEKFPPLFTCDNNAKIWGTEFCGLEVKSPEELTNLPEDCVIYICNMFYNEIKKQLVEMGVTNPIEFFNDEYLPSYHFNRI